MVGSSLRLVFDILRVLSVLSVMGSSFPFVFSSVIFLRAPVLFTDMFYMWPTLSV